MLLPTLVVLIRPWLKPEFKNMLDIIKKKMGENENGRTSSLGLLHTVTALQPKFQNVTLLCDDSLTFYPHKVILVAISTMSKGLLRKN